MGSDGANSPAGKYTATVAYHVENHVFSETGRYDLLTVKMAADGWLLRSFRIPHTAPEDFKSPRSHGPFTPAWASDGDSGAFNYSHDQVILGNIKAKETQPTIPSTLRCGAGHGGRSVEQR